MNPPDEVILVQLDAIKERHETQCRVSLDGATVTRYAEAMGAGVKFPPVVLFGTIAECWNGDGGHRIAAAEMNGEEEIEAILIPGTRKDALKHALGANCEHGKPRTNEDIKRTVELAIENFGDKTHDELAEMCNVSKSTIERYRRAKVVSEDLCPEPRVVTRGNGRPYTVNPRPAPEPDAEDYIDEQVDDFHQEEDDQPERKRRPNLPPPCMGKHHAWAAIRCLEEIKPNDIEREEAFATMKEWINDHE